MHILYLNPGAQLGGAETSLLELLLSIREAEPSWRLTLVVGGDGPLVSKASELGVSTRVVPMPPALASLGDSSRGPRGAMLPGFLSATSYARRLRRVLRAERPDLVHSTGFKMHVLGAWACPRGIPLIWHIHDYIESRPVMRRLLRWHARACRAVLVNSESVAKQVRTSLGKNVWVDRIYNAIDLDRFSPRGPVIDLDSASGLPAAPGVVRVGLVATFAWWKGHRVFLKALSLIPREVPLRGYIIGGPVYATAGSQESMEALREEASRLGLEGRIGFTGHLGDTAPAMRSLDIIVHASTAPEPFGMVIVEGMACGKPVVVSAGGGAREIFEDGVDALGHEPGDAQALARQILRLAEQPETRARFGQAGRQRVEAAYSRKRLAREILEAYRQQRVPNAGAAAFAATT